MDRVALVEGITTQLQGRGELTESRVLDGDGYFLDGRLVVAVVGEDLCLHVGRDHWQAALAGDGVRPLLFADLPVPGWIIVDGASVDAGVTLARWIESALARG